jgi:hypothetical protein
VQRWAGEHIRVRAMSPSLSGGAVGLFTALVCAAMAVFGLAGSRAQASPYVAVNENHLVAAHGAQLRLLGVDRSGTEYMCLGGSEIFDGPASAESVQAMAAWHINAVRVPLNEDCWLGIDGISPQTGGGG